MIEDIRRAVSEHRRHLRGLIAYHHETEHTTPADWRIGAAFFTAAQVTAMLRVEIESPKQVTVWQEAEHDTELHAQLVAGFEGRTGPLTIMGVALYFVDRLPAPGWRVVNPMLAKGR